MTTPQPGHEFLPALPPGPERVDPRGLQALGGVAAGEAVAAVPMDQRHPQEDEPTDLSELGAVDAKLVEELHGFFAGMPDEFTRYMARDQLLMETRDDLQPQEREGLEQNVLAQFRDLEARVAAAEERAPVDIQLLTLPTELVSRVRKTVLREADPARQNAMRQQVEGEINKLIDLLAANANGEAPSELESGEPSTELVERVTAGLKLDQPAGYEFTPIVWSELKPHQQRAIQDGMKPEDAVRLANSWSFLSAENPLQLSSEQIKRRLGEIADEVNVLMLVLQARGALPTGPTVENVLDPYVAPRLDHTGRKVIDHRDTVRIDAVGPTGEPDGELPPFDGFTSPSKRDIKSTLEFPAVTDDADGQPQA